MAEDKLVKVTLERDPKKGPMGYGSSRRRVGSTTYMLAIGKTTSVAEKDLEALKKKEPNLKVLK